MKFTLSPCVVCGGHAAAYKTPNDSGVLVICADAGCKRRRKPPVLGFDAQEAARLWNLNSEVLC